MKGYNLKQLRLFFCDLRAVLSKGPVKISCVCMLQTGARYTIAMCIFTIKGNSEQTKSNSDPYTVSVFLYG